MQPTIFLLESIATSAAEVALAATAVSLNCWRSLKIWIGQGKRGGNQPSWQAEILELACTQIGHPLLLSR
jgi:hypothetical protein